MHEAMSAEQKDRIALNRERAVQRKLQKQCEKEIPLPEPSEEHEDQHPKPIRKTPCVPKGKVADIY